MFSTNKYYIGILNLYISLLLHLVSESYLYDLKFKSFLCFGFRQFISLSVNSYLIIDIMNINRGACSTISHFGWLNFYFGNCRSIFFISVVILVHWSVRFFNYKLSITKKKKLNIWCCSNLIVVRIFFPSQMQSLWLDWILKFNLIIVWTINAIYYYWIQYYYNILLRSLFLFSSSNLSCIILLVYFSCYWI